MTLLLKGYSNKRKLRGLTGILKVKSTNFRIKTQTEKLCLKTLENIPERSPLFNHIPAPRVTCYDYNLRKSNALTTIK